MRNRRDRRNPNNTVYFITNRTKEGLPFVARFYMRLILIGIMAKAQRLYHVNICHFLWMLNHYHLILAGEGKNVSKFVGYMQSEVAKAVKKLTPIYGKEIGNVWETRFKEQKICTAEDAIRMIVYIYLNPVTAGLVSKAQEWKGCSSYKMYLTGSYTYEGQKLPLKLLKRLPIYITDKLDLRLAEDFRKLATDKNILRLMPNMWKKCFEESKDWSDEYIYERIIKAIKEGEEEAKRIHGGKFMGMKAVQKQPLNKVYKPKKKEKTPYLICGDDKQRILEIKSYKDFCKSCCEAYALWKKGIYTAAYVYGAYRPGMSIMGDLRPKELVRKCKKKERVACLELAVI